ncbi:MAG: hypothetical protein IH851_05360 [Armatimonadetes bacterium]|nr:hypothetical protein [Armatimonadota bacterium]
MRRSRGSALVFVLVMIVAITTVLVATVELATRVRGAQASLENERSVGHSFDGVVDWVKSRDTAGSLSVPTVTTMTVGKIKWDVTVNDNGASIANSLRVDGSTVTKGGAYSAWRVIGRKGGVVRRLFDYALALGSDSTVTNPLTLGSGGSNGDAYVDGDVVWMDSATIVNGNLEATGTISPASLSVTGSKVEGAEQSSFPPVNGTDYLNSADQVLGSGGKTDIVGWTFSQNYELIYIDGDLTIQGGFSGTGTFYVTGEVEVQGDMLYLTADSRLAIITTQKIKIERNVTTLVGYIYTQGLLDVQDPKQDPKQDLVTLTSGGAVALTLISGRPFSIIHDPTVKNDPSVGYNLKLPGYWP